MIYAMISVVRFCCVLGCLCIAVELFAGLYKEFDIWKVPIYISLLTLAAAYIFVLFFGFGLILVYLPTLLIHLLLAMCKIIPPEYSDFFTTFLFYENNISYIPSWSVRNH